MKRGAVCVAVAVVLGMTGCTANPAPAAPSATSRPVDNVFTIAAIGDSITAAVNSCEAADSCRTNSWSTGTNADVDSLASRLRTSGYRVHGVNFAVPGERIGGLAAQIGRLGAAKPKLVTVLVGANDICASSKNAVTDQGVFATRAQAMISAIQQVAPSAIVYVSSVPDVARLATAIGADPAAQQTWDRHPICLSALYRPTSTDEVDVARRSAVEQRVKAYNDALQDACAAYTKCVWDDNAVFTHAFKVSEVSTIDYFHPSVAGQAAIASIAWDRLQPVLAG